MRFRPSRPLWTPIGAMVLIGLHGALVAGPAEAATGRITEVTSANGQLRVVFSATDLPAGTTVDPASVRVTVDGTALEAKATPVVAGTVRRTAVLVIDTSGSMRGDGIAGAKQAGKDFVGAVPDDVEVGLVSFSDQAVVRVAPTKDHGRVASAVDALVPAGETSLYDGVLLGLRQLGSSGVRNLLVLSDGADTRSRATLDQVISALRPSEATADVVAFQTPDATGAVLRRIAAAGHGRSLTAARASDVAAAFRETARAISDQLVVTATVPAALAGRQVSVEVTVRAGSTEITDEVSHTLAAVTATTGPSVPKPARTSSSPFDRTPVRLAALAMLFLGLAIALVLAFGTFATDRPTGRVRRRLSLYTLTGRVVPEREETTVLGESAVARSAVELAGRFVGRRGFDESLALELDRGGIPLRPAEWLLIHAGTTVLVSLLMLFLGGGRALPALLGLLIGLGLPFGYLRLKAARRASTFVAQVPDTLQLLAGSLQAGYSFPQAVDAVVREGAQPMATELGRALIESRLGVPIEDALDHAAERMGSRDFAWVVMAIRIQREVGGNLAEVLVTVAGTMRERDRVRRQVRVLSAEGRLSAYILGGLPPLFALYLVLIRPEYIRPLYTEWIGRLMLLVTGSLFVGGVFWLRKAVKVEV